MQIIAQQLNRLRQKIHDFEQKYGREKGSVKLLAVSKTRSEAEILEALACDQHDFGENYEQEAIRKVEALADRDITWHFIGSLQSNKAKGIARHFAWLHSLDRLKIARRVSALRAPDLPDLNVCIQLNISHESSKSGAAEKDLALLAEEIINLPGLRLRGLMAMPAPTADFDEQRRGFRLLRGYLEHLNSSGHRLDTLSMGTTADMEAAIAEGATIVRVGTAIFGPRK